MTPERTNKINDILLKRQPDLAVVMENVDDPHNIAAVMRTCDAVGIQDIYVLNTRIPPHGYFGVRSSSSAAKWLTVHQFNEIDLCFEALRKKYKHIYSTHLGSDSIGLFEIDFTQPVALVFGNEHDGVSEATRNLCDGNFTIPQVGMIQSLNISVACAISIYEAFRQKNIAGHYNREMIIHPDATALIEKWGLKKEKWRMKKNKLHRYK